jgi:fructose-1,6-bisphosphatase/inositol monophosphatase family enzyme
MKAMDHVLSGMREERIPYMKCRVENPHIHKSEQNLTKVIDQEAEDIILDALRYKFAKLPEVKAYTVFTEEMGIKTFPEDANWISMISSPPSAAIQSIQNACPSSPPRNRHWPNRC